METLMLSVSDLSPMSISTPIRWIYGRLLYLSLIPYGNHSEKGRRKLQLLSEKPLAKDPQLLTFLATFLDDLRLYQRSKKQSSA